METIRKATKQSFENMPRIFDAMKLCATVRQIMGRRRRTMDGTILRRLRELRADGECNYRVFDSAMAKYEKVD